MAIDTLPRCTPLRVPVGRRRGRTREACGEHYQLLQSKIHPDFGRLLLSTELNGVDLSAYSVDGPFPFQLFPDLSKLGFAGLNVLEKARSENLTIREVYNWYAGARGQRTLRGGPKRIADEMEEWFVNYGVDGFLIQPAHLPGGLRRDAGRLAAPTI